MLTGSTLVRVVPRPSGGWDVREPGTVRPLGHAADRDAAILRAWSVMLNGGVVQVLNGDGFLVETHTVPRPGGRAWWYLAPRRLSWLLAGLFVAQGGLGVVVSGPGEFRFWLGVVQVLLGASLLVLTLLSRRLDRRLLRSDVRVEGPGPV